MGWALLRLSEKHSQVALGAALTATGAVASQPSSWTAGGETAWFALIPVWVAALVHVVLPDATGPVTSLDLSASPVSGVSSNV